MKRNILKKRNPYFLPAVTFDFIKAAVKEKSIAVLWFIIHVFSFVAFLMIINKMMGMK